MKASELTDAQKAFIIKGSVLNFVYPCRSMRFWILKRRIRREISEKVSENSTLEWRIVVFYLRIAQRKNNSTRNLKLSVEKKRYGTDHSLKMHPTRASNSYFGVSWQGLSAGDH